MRAQLATLCLLLLPFNQQDPRDVAKPGPVLPVVGKPAPTFRLNDQNGKAVQVGGKAKTWTVLAFYPKAATPG